MQVDPGESLDSLKHHLHCPNRFLQLSWVQREQNKSDGDEITNAAVRLSFELAGFPSLKTR